MNKQGIYDLLDELGIWHEVTEHRAVYNMAEVAQIELPYPEADAKNLFLRDDKRRAYYLVSMRGDKRLDLKAFRRAQGTRPLSFASEEELRSILGLIAGAVTPFGLLNDEERRVALYLDKDLLEEPGILGVHPNDNTATVWLHAQDLVRVVEEHGNEVHVVEM